MFLLKGRAPGGRSVVIIGIPQGMLLGVANEGMAITLDGVRGPSLGLGDADFVFILRADTEEELKKKLPHNVTVTLTHKLQPGIIE